MNVHRRLLSLVLPSLGLVGFFAAARWVDAAEPSEKVSEEEGAAHFAAAATVLLSPRCKNCHPSGNAPLHGDSGAPHSMNVSRLSASSGLNCTTCHRSKNKDVEHSPPGVPNWHMPAAETPLIFEGFSAAELCNRLKDPTKNGGRTVADLTEHVGHDPFVLWAWNPGPGRSLPPMPHATFVEHMRKWALAGGPCPAPPK